MENENTNENKKKQKITILIGVVTLLIAVLGATYAYFQISTNTESSNTNITGSTPPKSLVTLKQGTSNLHLNISASDMSYENRTKEYYGTDDEQPYVGTEELGTKTIATVELTGGEATTKYSCTAKLTVSKVTEPLEEADTMVEVLQPGDMILQFKGNIISEQLDLSDLKENNPKEYNLSFKITGNKVEEIQAYIKLVNKETQQNYLSGKKLNIDINTSDLKCNIAEPETIDKLRKNDIQKYLTEDTPGGMYRYQAAGSSFDTATMTNWIVFGTDKNCEKDAENKCTNIENMTYDDYVDKYMYRIIGITEEGEMYLLKETFLKEGETNKFAWNSKYLFPDCLDYACEWPNSDLYKRLNGEESNGNPIFINNERYNYMVEKNKWFNLIVDHEWMYGDTNELPANQNTYNGNYMYAIETGYASTVRWWPDEGHSDCSGGLCTSKTYTWSKSTEATKIGLMYMHDVLFAYPGGNPGSATNVKNSWLHYRKDGYNASTFYDFYDMLIDRTGAKATNLSSVTARFVSDSGGLFSSGLTEMNGVRPTFYLSSKAKIASGNGTKSNPYILDVQV